MGWALTDVTVFCFGLGKMLSRVHIYMASDELFGKKNGCKLLDYPGNTSIPKPATVGQYALAY